MREEPQHARPHPRTILIIDDEPAVRNVTRSLLERVGYRVVAAGSGAEGIHLLETEGEAVDLVVLDLTMPQMGGREVLAELAKVRPDVRVLLASGFATRDNIPDGPNIVGFLSKPFRFEELVRTVREAIA